MRGLACHHAALSVIGLIAGVQEIDRRNKEREILNINMPGTDIVGYRPGMLIPQASCSAEVPQGPRERGFEMSTAALEKSWMSPHLPTQMSKNSKISSSQSRGW